MLEIHAQGVGTGINLGETHFHLVTLRDGKVAEAKFFRDRGQALAAAGPSA